jgi:hypothetical protein
MQLPEARALLGSSGDSGAQDPEGPDTLLIEDTEKFQCAGAGFLRETITCAVELA